MHSMIPIWNAARALAMFGDVPFASMRALTSPPTRWQSASAGTLAGAAMAKPDNAALRMRLDRIVFDPRISISWRSNSHNKLRSPRKTRIDLHQGGVSFTEWHETRANG